MRGKLPGDALRQRQRQRDLSIRFGAFKVPSREDSAVWSSRSDSDLWPRLWLVSRQMSAQPGAAWKHQWVQNVPFIPVGLGKKDGTLTSNLKKNLQKSFWKDLKMFWGLV